MSERAADDTASLGGNYARDDERERGDELRATESEVESEVTLEDELLDLILRHSRRGRIPILLAGLVVVALAYGTVHVLAVAAWMTALTGVVMFRSHQFAHVIGDTARASQARLRRVVILSACSGGVQAAAVLFFPFLDPPDRAIITVLLLGLCTGALVTTAGHRPSYLAFATPVMALLAGMWAVNPGGPLEWQNAAMAALILLLGAVLLNLSRDTFRVFSNSFQIRSQRLELTERLRAALAASEAANAAKTRFLASASHDLRQPAQALRLFINALARQDLDDKSRTITNDLRTAAVDLTNQLDALLDVSRLDAGVVEVSADPVDLSALLCDLQHRFLPQAQEKGLTLDIDCPPTAIVRSDPTHLGSILSNLLSNAIKYTDAGNVTVQVKPAGANLRIAVQDTGRGIAAADQAHIYEEFFQIGNPHRDKSRGLGLGLAIVRRLARLLDVKVHLDSTPGQGSVFAFEVPSWHSDTPLPSLARHLTESDNKPNLRRSPLAPGTHVLAVDDEPRTLRALRLALESHDCVVATAASTAEAVTLAGADRFDVLVCDFRLVGDDNGLQTIDAVRALHPGTPAILITGDTAPDRLQEANAADVTLLHKPVDDLTIAQAIADCLSENAAASLS